MRLQLSHRGNIIHEGESNHIPRIGETISIQGKHFGVMDVTTNFYTDVYCSIEIEAMDFVHNPLIKSLDGYGFIRTRDLTSEGIK